MAKRQADCGSFQGLSGAARVDPGIAAVPGDPGEGPWSVVETAARLGVTRWAVWRAIKRGRLEVQRDEKGRVMIRPEAAAAAWTPRKMPSLKDVVSIEGADVGAFIEDVWRSRARREAAEAEAAELKAAVLRGELIASATIAKTAAARAREAQEVLLTLPSRLAPTIAGLTDPSRIEKLLFQALSDALEDVERRVLTTASSAPMLARVSRVEHKGHGEARSSTDRGGGGREHDAVQRALAGALAG